MIGKKTNKDLSFNFICTRCDQKVLSLIHFKAFHKTKSSFSLSFYLIESHLESKNHLVTLDCFCTTVLRENSASKLAKWRKLK